MTLEELLRNFNAWYPAYLGMLLVMAVFIGADWVLGIARAIKDKVFTWKKIAQIFTKWIGLVLTWTFASFLAGILPQDILDKAELAKVLIPNGIYVSILVQMGASVLGHMQALGLPINLSSFGLPPTGKQT